jgi:hypothetical protein
MILGGDISCGRIDAKKYQYQEQTQPESFFFFFLNLFIAF